MHPKKLEFMTVGDDGRVCKRHMVKLDRLLIFDANEAIRYGGNCSGSIDSYVFSV